MKENFNNKEDHKFTLDNKEVTETELSEAFEKLKSNQRIVETRENTFYTVERLKG